MHHRIIKKKIIYEKGAPQAGFFMKQNEPKARLIKQSAPQANILIVS